jgi:hypothetical protein
MANLGPGQQDIGTFEQAAGVRKLHQQTVVSPEPFPEPSELNEQRGEHGEANQNKRAYFQLETFIAMTRRHFSGRC